ncbi:MAG: hypothetical protein OWT28_04765 [Firmicutes bacterium]|nr:hypothetical protein [Bacillota bacterium]
MSSMLFTSRRDRVLAFFTFGLAQIMITVFLAGAIFETLRPVPVTLCALLLSWPSPAFWLWQRYSLRMGLGSAQQVSDTDWTDAATRRMGPTGWLAVCIGGLSLAVTAAIGYLLPPYSADALSYHLVTVASWLHDNRIAPVPASLWSNVYPKNAELVFTWFYLFFRGTLLIHFGQWVFAVAGMAAIYGVARLLGISRGAAFIASSLFMLAPTIFLQATTNYVDLAFAGSFFLLLYFALAYTYRPSLSYLVAAGVAGGMALGIKADGALYVGICALLMLSFGLLAHRKRLLRDAFIFTALVLTLGLYWYVQTWIAYGSPFYPFTITVLGRTIFSGIGTVHNLIMVPNTPPSMRGLPFWKQDFIAWTHLPNMVSYDMVYEAFGLQWAVFELPALLLFTVWTVWRRRWLFARFVLPLWLIFVLQSANWWGRYTMFMVAFGAIAFVYLIELMRYTRLRIAIYLTCYLLIGFTFGYGIEQSLQTPVQQAGDSRNLIQDAVLSMRLNPEQRTVGRLIFPEYAWVERLRQPAVVAFTPFVPYPFPLFGLHAQNTVIDVMVKNADIYAHEVIRDHIQYLMTNDGSPQYLASRARRTEFSVYWAGDGFTVFAVNQADAHLRRGVVNA